MWQRAKIFFLQPLPYLSPVFTTYEQSQEKSKSERPISISALTDTTTITLCMLPRPFRQRTHSENGVEMVNMLFQKFSPPQIMILSQ